MRRRRSTPTPTNATTAAAGSSVLLFILAAAVAAEEPRLSPVQEGQLERLAVEARLLDTLAGLQASDLARLDGMLTEFAAADLARLERPGTLGHVLRAVAFRRTHGAKLQQKDVVAFGLGSTDPDQLLRGIVALHKEPFGRALEEVAVALADDPRPVVRRCPGSVAKLLTLFRGPSPACDAIAVGLTKDRDPRLAAMFIGDCYDFQRPAVVDGMIEALRDARRGPGAVSVGTMARRAFLWHWSPRERGPKPDRRAYPQKYDYRNLRRWWRGVRDTWNFGPDPERWEVKVRHKGALDPQPARVVSKHGQFWVRVANYAEGPDQGLGPTFSARIDVAHDRDFKDLVVSAGNNDHHFGWVMKGRSGVFHRACVMPDWRGRMRLWLEVWGRK